MDATPYHDAGGSDAEELAASLATGVAYLRALTDAGLGVEDALGQLEFRYAATAGQQTRAAVQAQQQPRATGDNPWSTSYNPLKSFRSERTRAEVTAEYLASRNQVSAFTGEDSGAAYLAQHKNDFTGSTLAGQPVNAQ